MYVCVFLDCVSSAMCVLHMYSIRYTVCAVYIFLFWATLKKRASSQWPSLVSNKNEYINKGIGIRSVVPSLGVGAPTVDGEMNLNAHDINGRGNEKQNISVPEVELFTISC